MRSRPLALSLKLSLLSALGLLPAACGGVSTSSPNGSAGAAGTSPIAHTPSCTAPTQTPDPDVVSCNEGYTYRKGPSACSFDPAVLMQQRALPQVTTTVDCSSDASVCNNYQFGRCTVSQGPSGVTQSCVSGCGSDLDCGGGTGTCRCAGAGFGQCAYDACRSDADCATGYHCASSPAGCGNGNFSCQTAADTCVGAADCPAGQFCLDQGDHHGCGPGSVCGRPFLVRSEARVAPTQAGSRWGALPTCTPKLEGLSSAERAQQAEHWTRMGQMEHASIAAFARFNLQLLSLGAPAELVEACNQALVDETNHARLCFGLASTYAGRAIGPGPLDIAMSLEQTSLLDVVDLVLAEGCFGETSAALEALELLETSGDPAIVQGYRVIAADEQRHAELAFRFVAWALEQEPRVAERIHAAVREYPTTPEVRSVVATCFDALLERRAAA